MRRAEDRAKDASDSDTVRPMGLASLRENYLNQVQRDCLSRRATYAGQHP